MTEQQLKKLILDYLTTKGHFVWTNNSGFSIKEYTTKDGTTHKRAWRAGKVGGSDIIGVEKGTGRFIVIECKVGRNTVTPEQRDFLNEIKRKGGLALVAYSLEDVQKWF